LPETLERSELLANRKVHKNAIALKEARESKFWLRVIIACGLNSDPEAERLMKEAGEIIGIFTGTVRSSRIRSAKGSDARTSDRKSRA
jgi:four helix bundle protein